MWPITLLVKRSQVHESRVNAERWLSELFCLLCHFWEMDKQGLRISDYEFILPLSRKCWKECDLPRSRTSGWGDWQEERNSIQFVELHQLATGHDTRSYLQLFLLCWCGHQTNLPLQRPTLVHRCRSRIYGRSGGEGIVEILKSLLVSQIQKILNPNKIRIITHSYH